MFLGCFYILVCFFFCCDFFCCSWFFFFGVKFFELWIEFDVGERYLFGYFGQYFDDKDLVFFGYFGFGGKYYFLLNLFQ